MSRIIPRITQKRYNTLDGESLTNMKNFDTINYEIFAHPLVKRLLNYDREKALIIAAISDYNIYENLFLASLNMKFFIEDKSYKRNFFKINFAFPYLNIEKYKSLIPTKHVNTEHYIQFVVNPKLIRYNTISFNPGKKENVLSTAHVYRTPIEKDAYDCVKSINDFFQKTTGEVLFFKF